MQAPPCSDVGDGRRFAAYLSRSTFYIRDYIMTARREQKHGVVFNASTTCNNSTLSIWTQKKGLSMLKHQQILSSHPSSRRQHDAHAAARPPQPPASAPTAALRTRLTKRNTVKLPLFDGRPPPPWHSRTVYSWIQQVYRFTEALCSPKQTHLNIQTGGTDAQPPPFKQYTVIQSGLQREATTLSHHLF